MTDFHNVMEKEIDATIYVVFLFYYLYGVCAIGGIYIRVCVCVCVNCQLSELVPIAKYFFIIAPEN
jgi:hypothetical protein